MTPEPTKEELDELRIKVAEKMGWRDITERHDSQCCQIVGIRPWLPKDPRVAIPDFCRDLNACASMEKTLTFSERQRYYDAIQEVMSIPVQPERIHWKECIRATALQRCRAFIAATEGRKGEVKP